MGLFTEINSTVNSLTFFSLLRMFLCPDTCRSGYYKMTRGVCLSVCPSVACLDLTRKRKGLGSPKLAECMPIKRVTVNLFRGQKVKGQGHQAD